MARVELDGRPYDIEDLVIAGWTGRDVAALEHHGAGLVPRHSVNLKHIADRMRNVEFRIA